MTVYTISTATTSKIILNTGDTINITSTGSIINPTDECIFVTFANTNININNAGYLKSTNLAFNPIFIASTSSVDQLINTGNIGNIGDTNAGISCNTNCTITTLDNFGIISFILNNDGIISNLNNSQSGLIYKSKLPTNYNIVINNLSLYGQLFYDNTSTSVTVMIFDIYYLSTLTAGTYTNVITGLDQSLVTNTSGTFGNFNWNLVFINNGGTKVFNLVVTKSQSGGLNPETAACTSQPGGPQPPRLWSRGTLSCIPLTSTITQYDLDMRRKAEILKYKANSAQLTKKQKWSQMVRGNGPLGKKVWANQNILGSNPNIYNLPLGPGNTLVCPSTSDYFDTFGYSVSLSDDGLTMVVSAVFAGSGSETGVISSYNTRGKIYIYKNNAGSWQLVTSFTGENNLDAFGTSVYLSGNGTTLAVGAPGYDNGKGKVYIYNYSGGLWQLVTYFTGENNNNGFGYSISLSDDGNTLAVGAFGFNTATGKVYIYNYNGGVWSYNTLSDGTQPNDRFGWSVSLSDDGTRLAVGSPGYTNSTGRVYIYKYSGGTWNDDIDFSGENSDDLFGWRISLSGDGLTLVVGAPGNNNGKGKVYIYNYSGGTWNDDIDFSGENSNDSFGSSVSLSNDGLTLVVGAPFFNNSTGKIYIYKYSGGTWQLVPSSFNGENSQDLFGYSISLSGDVINIVTGVPGYNNFQGKIYIYNYSAITDTWSFFYSILGTANTNNNISRCSPSTASDVPGPQITLCYNPNIPLVNYIVQRTYLAGGTKFPQTCWQPGDDGFPVGKAGSDTNQ